MRIFYTLSDKNFLHYGLSLHHSLDRSCDEFLLYYFCLDRDSYDFLRQLDKKNIYPVWTEDVEKMQIGESLVQLRNNPPSFEAIQVGNIKKVNPQYYQYMWALSSFLGYFLLETADGIYDVTYLDADVYFFKDWRVIYQILGKHSVGLVRNNSNNDEANGKYNVSFIYFSNDLTGIQCLYSWKNWLLDPQNEFAAEYGKCADQKYLELFEQLFKKKDILILDDAGLVQLSPWSLKKLNQCSLDDVVFYHFSDFQPDYEMGTYKMAPRHGLIFDNSVKSIYDEYYQVSKQFFEIVNK